MQVVKYRCEVTGENAADLARAAEMTGLPPSDFIAQAVADRVRIVTDPRWTPALGPMDDGVPVRFRKAVRIAARGGDGSYRAAGRLLAGLLPHLLDPSTSYDVLRRAANENVPYRATRWLRLKVPALLALIPVNVRRSTFWRGLRDGILEDDALDKQPNLGTPVLPGDGLGRLLSHVLQNPQALAEPIGKTEGRGP